MPGMTGIFLNICFECFEFQYSNAEDNLTLAFRSHLCGNKL